MNLYQVEIGKKVKVKDMSLIEQETTQRLMNLGITEGAEIVIKSKMALHGPIVMECNGQLISIRCKCSKHIIVE